mgnify:CR=1 FL=1
MRGIQPGVPGRARVQRLEEQGVVVPGGACAMNISTMRQLGQVSGLSGWARTPFLRACKSYVRACVCVGVPRPPQGARRTHTLARPPKGGDSLSPRQEPYIRVVVFFACFGYQYSLRRAIYRMQKLLKTMNT